MIVGEGLAPPGGKAEALRFRPGESGSCPRTAGRGKPLPYRVYGKLLKADTQIFF